MIARSVASLSPADVGDYVCWVVPPDDDFQRTPRAYLQDGARIGDKLMVVRAAFPAWREFQPSQALLVDPVARRQRGLGGRSASASTLALTLGNCSNRSQMPSVFNGV